MTQFFYPSVREGFSLIGSELCEVKLVRIETTFKTDEKSITKNIVCHKGKEFEVDKSNFYASIEDFKNAKSVTFEDYLYVHWTYKNLKVDVKDGTYMHLMFWKFENGEPVYKDIYDFKATISWNEKGRRQFSIDVVSKSECFKTKDDCYSFNQFVVSHEDGTKTTEVGAGALCQLNDKQKGIIERLRAVIAEAKENNIKLILDYSLEEIFAVNTEHVADTYFDCVEAPDGFELVNLEHPSFLVESGLVVISEDTDLFIKRKA